MMKIKLFSLLFLNILFSLAVSGQGLDFGFKVGSDLHKVTGKSFNESFRFGYHAGAFVTLKLKKIDLQPEVYFSQTNTKDGNDVNSVLTGIDRKIKLSYLNIPIMVNLKFNKNVAFQLGPQYSILMNEENSLVTNGKNAFKKGDFSLAGGLQVKILKFRVYGRYVAGLNNINDINNTEKWRNRVLHIGVGYAIL